MKRLEKMIPSSLVGQFVLAGGFVMLAAALIVGTWVSARIEQGVVQNSAVSAALYMDGFLSPLSQELADDNGLSEPARAALQEIFMGAALGERIVSYKIWKQGGLVVEASDEDLKGRTFTPSEDLIGAWNGQISASFEELNDDEDAGEAALGIPLLEVYSPIREVWTGDIVAVAEFYERADGLASELLDAKRTSWIIVLGVFATSGLLLFGIVQTGSRLISRQRVALENQLTESRRMSAQNAELKDRVVAAAQRSTAQADRVMQRIGLDLHDGVAQHLSLASLRFEAAEPSDGDNATTVRKALDAAMSELRAISRGLALPDIEQLALGQTLSRAIEDHRKAYHVDVDAKIEVPEAFDVLYPIKLCAYRFIQEALANATRYAKASEIDVHGRFAAGAVEISVSDNGVGFDADSISVVRTDGGQGLHGLRDRAETLNGQVTIESTKGEGTTLRLVLPIEEEQR